MATRQEEYGLCKACVNHPVVLCCVNTFRWVPVIFLVAIIVWAYYAYVIELCIFTIPNKLEAVLYILLYHFFLILFLWAYYQTIFAPIASPAPKFTLPPDLVRDLKTVCRPSDHRMLLERFVTDTNLPVTMRAFDGAVRYCEKCSCIKPDRCHHCSVCGQCVLKFDHHCPWVNTCVNYGNYKFFIQFLGYALLLCTYVFLTDIQYFIWFWEVGLMETGGASKFHIMFMFFVAGMFAISISALFFYHLWLTGKNRSTIESFRAPVFTYGPDGNGFNLGWRENFKEVFGDKRLFWFLPIFSSRGNGCSFRIPTTSLELGRNNGLNNVSTTDTRPQLQGERQGFPGQGPGPGGDTRRVGHSRYRHDITPSNNKNCNNATTEWKRSLDGNYRNSDSDWCSYQLWAEPASSSTTGHKNNNIFTGVYGAVDCNSAYTSKQGAISSRNSVPDDADRRDLGACKALDSGGNGMVFSRPVTDPEVNNLLNRTYPKWEEDAGTNSDSSIYDNTTARTANQRLSQSDSNHHTQYSDHPYRPGNNNWICTDTNPYHHSGIQDNITLQSVGVLSHS